LPAWEEPVEHSLAKNHNVEKRQMSNSYGA
jgi:hypothetical protein